MFIDATTFIGKTVTVQMDRPLGSQHPEWGFDYPVNYGYLPGVAAPDGDELDAYLLGVTKPVSGFIGICIAVIRRLNDDDDKLIVVPAGVELTDVEIRELTDFQERFFESIIVRAVQRT